MDKNRISVYLKPFDVSGNYLDDWINITDDVISIGETSIGIDSQDYQLGVYTNSNVSLSMNNSNGKYSDIDVDTSLFLYKRAGSKVKITYNLHYVDPLCGLVDCGDFFLGGEETIFEGLLNDESYKFDAKSEKADFIVMGLEYILSQKEVNFADLEEGVDSIEDILLLILDQEFITDMLTVSASNINVGINYVPDVLDWMEGKTVREALDDLLFLSNSVLYIDDYTIYITDRAAGSTTAYTFYGQGSSNGVENIIDIQNFNKGMHRMFNYVPWKDSSIYDSEPDSIAIYGVRRKEIDHEAITTEATQESISGAIVDEFGFPKIEMELTTMLEYETLALNLLNKVIIDYPIPYVATTDEAIPICGIAVCGSAVLPKGLWSLYIPTTKSFKIIEKKINTKNLEITFKLREV